MSTELIHPSLSFASGFRWRNLLPDNIVTAGRVPIRGLAGFVLAWAVLLLILKFLPLPTGLSSSGKAPLAIMVWAGIIWISEALPVAVSGLLIPMLLVLTNAVTPLSKAANGFTNPVVFLCLVAFIFSAIVQVAGLDRKIALGLLDRIKVKTVNGVIWSLFVVNLVLSFVLPAANARTATLLPVVNGLTSFFGNTEQEHNAKKSNCDSSLGVWLHDQRYVHLDRTSSQYGYHGPVCQRTQTPHFLS